MWVVRRQRFNDTFYCFKTMWHKFLCVQSRRLMLLYWLPMNVKCLVLLHFYILERCSSHVVLTCWPGNTNTIYVQSQHFWTKKRLIIIKTHSHCCSKLTSLLLFNTQIINLHKYARFYGAISRPPNLLPLLIITKPTRCTNFSNLFLE